MNNKKNLYAVLALVLVAAALMGVYWLTKPKTQAGAKTVTVTVFDASGSNVFNQELNTNAETLGDLLESENLAAFQTSTYGRFIVSVTGIEADSAAQQWWHISIDGAEAAVGCDELPVTDGAVYTLTLKTGY